MASLNRKKRCRLHEGEELCGDRGGRATESTGGVTTHATTHPKLVTPIKAVPYSDETDQESLLDRSEEDQALAPDSHWQNVFGVRRRVATVPAAVHRVYRDSQRHVRRLGDGDSSDPMNGEFTPGSVQRILAELRRTTRLGEGPAAPVFVDIGSGTGKVVMHAAACVPQLRAMGVEVSQTRYMISLHCHRDALQRQEEYGHRVLFKRADVLDLTSLGEVTHLYMASAAFPDLLMLHLAKLWNASTTVEYLICNHDPRQMIYDYEFQVKDLEVKVPCKMHGSGEGKTFYFYKRCHAQHQEPVPSDRKNNILLTRDELESLNVNYRKVRLDSINEAITSFQNEPTPKRVRRVIRYT